MTPGEPDKRRGAPRPGFRRGAPFSLPGRFRAAVFDLDGLLIDTEPLWVLAETELLERHGVAFTADDAQATHGRSIEDTIVAYAGRLGGVDEDALRAELVALMRVHYLAGPPVRAGARELIRALEGRLALGVASNTDGDLVRAALAAVGLLDAFGVVASGADIGRAKPFPDVYLAACRTLGVPPRDAIAFEDSPAGVRSAKAAGLTCVAVPERADVDLRVAGADGVVASLADLVGLVAEVAAG